MADRPADQRVSKPTDPSDSGGVAGSRSRPDRTGAQRLPAHLRLKHLPVLRNPVLVMAFEGWNDVGEAATTAARLLVSQRDGNKFASIDPEEFFVFTDTRPYVRHMRRGRRRIDWPANEFFACVDPSDDPAARDLIVLAGTEPDLRWRTFSETVLEVARRSGVQLVIALGSLGEDVPHTLPPSVSGSSMNRELHPLLKEVGLKSSKYEGPTGIVTVLTSRFGEAGYPSASLWGHAPHYITASPNPVVAAKILREVAGLLQLSLDMDMLDQAAQRFNEQVREAVSKDPEAMAYVRDLERRYHEGPSSSTESSADESARAPGGELPSGAAVVDALEEFLRRRRRPPGSAPATE